MLRVLCCSRVQANLAVQEARLIGASSELAAAQATLDEKQAELDAVQAMYDKAMAEKQELLDDAESCRNKMTAASTLIGGLAGERVRWTQQSKEFKEQIDRSVNCVLQKVVWIWRNWCESLLVILHFWVRRCKNFCF